MVSSDDIFEVFDDLGYSIEDTRVIDKLCSLCESYGIDQKKLSKEYLTFALTKKYDEPNLVILENFESEILRNHG